MIVYVCYMASNVSDQCIAQCTHTCTYNHVYAYVHVLCCVHTVLLKCIVLWMLCLCVYCAITHCRHKEEG